MNMTGGVPLPPMSQNLTQAAQPRLPAANMPTLPQTRLPMMPSLPGALSVPQGGTESRQMSMHLLREQSFTPMKEEVLTATLSAMKQPATKENVALAKSMVQSGVPLTGENVKELKTALAQLPSPKPSDMQAATFLKSAQLPMTPQNITTLSNFITMNPQLGACFFEFSKEFRRFIDNGRGLISADKMKIMSKTTSAMGELMMDFKSKGALGNARAFKNMAGQSGMEMPHFMMGRGDDELTELMKELRRVLYHKGDEASKELYSKLEQAFSKTEDVLLAQKLMNRAVREGQDNFYYMQLPVRIGSQDFTVEFKLFYTTDYEGRKVVDGNNFEFELLVPSCNMGDSHFHVKVIDGIMDMDVGMENLKLAEYMYHSLPKLLERTELMGLASGDCGVYVRKEDEAPLTIVETELFEDMEALDLSY